MRASSLSLLLFVFLCGSPLVLGQVNYIKYFKLYVKNMKTGVIQSCFPRDFSVNLETELSGYTKRDENNFASGFTSATELDVFGCPSGGSSQFDVGFDAWGCDIITDPGDDPNDHQFYQFKLKMVVCDVSGYAVQPTAEWTFASIGDPGTPPMPTSNVVIDLTSVSRVSAFSHDGDDYRVYETTDYFPTNGFGPESQDPSVVELTLTLFNGALSQTAEFNVRMRVRHANPCIDSARCADHLAVDPLEEPSVYLCPLPDCPPTWKLYSQDSCYQQLSVTDEQKIAKPLNDQIMFRIGGLRECTARGIPTKFCHQKMSAQDMACERFVNQDFRFS